MKYITSILLITIISCFAYLFWTAMPTRGNHSAVVTFPYEYLTKTEKSEIDCLAANILFEAGSESLNGKIAVASVTLNRVKSNDFENTICKVVKQKTNGVCQFSWWCDSNIREKFQRIALAGWRNDIYNEIRELAIHVYFNHGLIEDPSKGALYYHADYVNPNWNLIKTTTVGRHIFYKPKGDNRNDGKT